MRDKALSYDHDIFYQMEQGQVTPDEFREIQKLKKNPNNISSLVRVVPMLLLLLLLSSCEAVKGIFKAGMGFGIIVVIAVLVIIVGIVVKLRKK